MTGVPRRLPSPAGLQARGREWIFGPGGRTPRRAADVICRLSNDDVVRFCAAHQLGLDETVTRLVSTGTSLARFGDGELGAMMRPGYDLYLQRSSPQLRAELRGIWTLQDLDPATLLLGFPLPFTGAYWTGVWGSLWPELRLITRDDVRYGNSHVTRPVYFRRLGGRGVDLWRAVWAERSVCVVTGTGSRFDLIPELFGSAASVVLETAPPVDAYAQVDALERRLLAIPVDLVLLALGPTATVLAARLARRGRRALDIGHIVNSYKTVFHGADRPEHLPL